MRVFRTVFTLGLAALGASSCTSIQIDSESEAALVLETLSGRSGQSRLESTTNPPNRQATSFSVTGETYKADLYTPSGPRRGGIVLVPGLARRGKNDARLVRLAETLGRVGFEILVPDIPGFQTYTVRSEAVRAIAAAFAHLDEVDSEVPTGLIAFSFAVGPTLIASLQPEIRERVDFVVAVGGYYNLHRLISFYTTGRTNGSGGKTPGSPSDVKWVLARGLAESLESANDRAALSGIARRHLFARDDVGEDVAVAAGLSPSGQAVYELMTNTGWERVPQLIENLPEAVRAELEALNPAAHDLSQLRANLIILHGRADPIIPYTESVAMAEAVSPKRVQLFLIDGLAHVNLKPEQRDLPLLLAAIEALLAEREAGLR